LKDLIGSDDCETVWALQHQDPAPWYVAILRADLDPGAKRPDSIGLFGKSGTQNRRPGHPEKPATQPRKSVTRA